MESSAKNQMKVGIFVLVGTLLVIVSIFSLGGSRNIFTPTSTLHAHFPSVSGLNVGSVISLAGVNIGNVTSIQFRPEENKLDVTMTIETRFLSRVTEGASVEIRTQGALGDKFIYIIPGGIDSPPVADGATLALSTAPDLMAIVAEKGGEAGKIFDVISEVHKLMKTINDDQRAEKIMANFAEASASLKLSAIESQKLMVEMRSQNVAKINDSVEKFNRILTKIDSGEGTLGALINDSTVHEQIKGMLGGSSRKKTMKSLLRTSIEKGTD
jgi:phospholipid/cholesterol/gamma-HCH transport system substrate-binding protein